MTKTPANKMTRGFAVRWSVIAIIAVCCCVEKTAGSAIPIWEFLSRDEKADHLWDIYIRQVAEYCSRSSLPDCDKNLKLSGITRLNGMNNNDLERMDPYQRNAKDKIWLAMTGDTRPIKSKITPDDSEYNSDPFATSESDHNGLDEESESWKDNRPLSDRPGPFASGPMVKRVYRDGRPVPGDANRPLPRDTDIDEFVHPKRPRINDIVNSKTTTINEFAYPKRTTINDIAYPKRTTVNEFVYPTRPTINEFVYSMRPTTNEFVYSMRPTINDVVAPKRTTINDIAHPKRTTINEFANPKRTTINEFVYPTRPTINDVVASKRTTIGEFGKIHNCFNCVKYTRVISTKKHNVQNRQKLINWPLNRPVMEIVRYRQVNPVLGERRLSNGPTIGQVPVFRFY